MEFTLVYRGPLKATTRNNSRVDNKQEIRRWFHVQLKELWKQEPLNKTDASLLQVDAGEEKNLIHDIGGFQFVTLVSERICLVAELDILMLRPEAPGAIVTQSGDIDNRLKTLFDALKLPKGSELPKNDRPKDGETPFFCLLEDDNLITKLAVTTDRLLVPVTSTNDVELLIRVKTKATYVTWGNLVLL